MKTPNLGIFLLAALFCGALFCTYAEAKVCFIGDEQCGSGAEFGRIDPLPTDDLCKQEGYTTVASACNNPGGVCPYDAGYVKCCSSEYAYQGCVFPLETVKKTVGGKLVNDKCGKLYKCQCPAEYKVTSDYAKSNNCQPGGGYCMLNSGNSDQVKYKTCSCDTSVYTDTSKCSNNQNESASCTDDKGQVRKKCYCDRSDGKYPFASCEYGNKGAICIDSNSKRAYYHECKTAEEKCREEGFEYNDCSGVHNCVSENGRYTSYNCILGPTCPYPVNPFLYKCVFDKASWCTNNGYTSNATVKPTNGAKCTTPDGFVGKYETCPANDSNSLFYYRCKLPCEQEVRRAYSKGYLTQDTKMVGDNGQVVGYVRGDSSKHLYFIGDITLPKTYTGDITWSKLSSYDYASINGMYALADSGMKYPDGSYMFSGCADERNNPSTLWTRPVVRFDGMLIRGSSWVLNKPMNDIAIQLYGSNEDDDESFGEKYYVDSNTWHNVTVQNFSMPNFAKIGNDEGKYHWLSSDCSEIVIRGSQTLRFTGNTRFRISAATYGKDCHKDFYTNRCTFISASTFRVEDHGVVEFRDAVIDSYSDQSASWDGDNGSMLFYNTKMNDSISSVGDIWSNMNVGLSNSSIRVNKIRLRGFGTWDTSRRFGGGSSNNPWDLGYVNGEVLSRCRGVYLKDYSTLEMIQAGWMFNNTKIYVGSGSSVNAKMPIMLNHKEQSLICLDYGKLTAVGNSYGSGRTAINGRWAHYRMVGRDSVNVQYSSGSNGIWYYKYDKGNFNGAFPCSTGGKCDGKCNSDFDAHYNGNNYLCTGCYNCTLMGMGY